jgi:serine/threonine protein kinase
MEPEPLHSGDPRRMGDYRLIGRLGEGGMGTVFLGLTPGGRKVAVKVMKRELAEDPESRYRFAREAEAAHGVGGFYTAQVIAAEPDDTLPWIASAYIPGPSLAEVIAASGPLGAKEVFELGAALAESLIAIHSQQLIHRDLKPSNIIMAGGGPRIIDFGIVRPTAASSLTATGIAIGSVPYMSPEHLSGKVVPESDVFSLGGVLAYASTGHGPFDAATNGQIQSRILTQPPDLDPLTGNMRKILTACLEKKPADRPTLRGLLAQFGSPGTAAGPGYEPTVTIPGKRGLSPAAPPLAAHGTEVTHIAFSPDGRLLATADRDLAVALWDADTWAPIAPPTSLVPPWATYNSQVDLGFSPDGRVLVNIAYYSSDEPSSGRHLAHALNTVDLGSAQEPSELPGSWVLLSPDGRYFFGSAGLTDSEIRAWDTARMPWRPRVLEGGGHAETYRFRPEFSPDGRFAGDYGHRDVRLWELATGAQAPVPSLASEPWTIEDLAIDPRGRLIALRCRVAAADYKSYHQDSIRVLDVTAGEPATARIVHDGALNYSAPVFSPDGCLLASLVGGGAGEIDVVWIWDPASGRAVDVVTRVSSWSTRLTFSPDSRFLAVGDGGPIAIRDIVAKRTIRVPEETDDRDFRAIAFSPDSRLLASSQDTVVQVWRLPDA